MARDTGTLTDAIISANEIELYDFVIIALDAEILYLTNRPGGYSGEIIGVDTDWIEYDFEHGPLRQAWQDILVVNWIKFANLDYTWTNYSYSESLRGKKVTIAQGWWNTSTVPSVFVDSYILYKGTFDDGEYKNEATITLKPHHIPWGTPVPPTKIGGRCINDYRNPDDCQYVGLEPVGEITCPKTRAGCDARGNTAHINIYDDCPNPGDKILYGGTRTTVAPAKDTNVTLNILTNTPDT